MENNCNNCGSTNIYGMSRVVGYYSIIENWNGSKQAEFVDRQKGDYKLSEGQLAPNEACETIGQQQVIVVH